MLSLDLRTLSWLIFGKKEAGEYPPHERYVIEPQVDASVERLDDRLLFRWQPQAVKVVIAYSADPDFANKRPLAQVMGQQEADITPPDESERQRLYYELQFVGGPANRQRLVTAERVLSLASGLNIRDIGGYQTTDGHHVRWGKLFRSGYLSQLAEPDFDYLTRLGLRIVCDLRTADEVAQNPDRLPPGTVYRHLAMYSSAEAAQEMRRILRSMQNMSGLLFDTYTELMLDRKAKVFAEFLALAAEPANLPLLLHCTAGKDRTGLAVALLLLLLGVPEPVVVADYTLSNLFGSRYRTDLAPRIQRLRRFGVSVNTFMPVLVADPQIMSKVLDYIRTRYRSVENYLHTVGGLKESTTAALRANLLE
jgi:protein-tyrosine phosphatase